MFSNLSIVQKGIILVIVPVLFECMFVLVLLQTAADATRKLNAIEHSKQGLLALHKFTYDMGRATEAFASTDMSRDERLRLCDSMEHLFSSENQIGYLKTSEYPELADEIAGAEELRGSVHALLKRIRTLLMERSTEATAPERRVGKVFLEIGRENFLMVVAQLQSLSKQIEQKETEAAISDPKVLLDSLNSLYLLLLAGLLASCAGTAALVYGFNTSILNRLKLVESNADSILLSKPLTETQKGTDELAQLDAGLHKAAFALALSKQRELAILDRSDDVICAVDKNLKFLSANKAAWRAWKYDDSELLGRSLISMVSSSSKSSTRSQFDAIAADTQTGELENQVVCGDGSVRDVLWTVQWLPEKATFFSVAHDVTERRSIERLRESFLSMVSHDLRAPLNAVVISSAILLTDKRGPIPDSARDELEKLEVEAKELIQRVDGLLDVAKSVSPQFSLSYRGAKEAEPL